MDMMEASPALGSGAPDEQPQPDDSRALFTPALSADTCIIAAAHQLARTAEKEQLCAHQTSQSQSQAQTMQAEKEDAYVKLMRSLREMNECLIEAAGGDQPQRAHRLRSKVDALKYQDPEAKLTDGKIVQHRVELRVVFVRVGVIETVKEIYEADVFLQARWRMPELDGLTEKELDKINLDTLWNPDLYIENLIRQEHESRSITAECDPGTSECYVTERRKIDGVFFETLELEDFPFDSQDLTVNVTSELPAAEIELVPTEDELCGVETDTFTDKQSWYLHSHLEVSKRKLKQDFISGTREQLALQFAIRASRRTGFFIFNIYMIMLLITSLSFVVYASPIAAVANRLELCYALLLTSIAFKFVVSKSIPRISYLTTVDVYILAGMLVQSLNCIWFAVVTNWLEWLDIRKLDIAALATIAVGYVLFHCFYVAWIYGFVLKRRRLMLYKDSEYREWMSRKLEWQRFVDKREREALAEEVKKKGGAGLAAQKNKWVVKS